MASGGNIGSVLSGSKLWKLVTKTEAFIIYYYFEASNHDCSMLVFVKALLVTKALQLDS